MADNPNVAGPDAATPSRAMTSPPASFPAAAASPGVPAQMGAAGAPAALKPAPAKRAGLRRFIVPVLILAALGYGGKTAYDWFVEGRFLVSTDDAYVGANTSIIAAKAMGHLTAVPVVDNQVVHKGDLLVSIDDGDYQNAVDSARARIGTQDATIARFARQIDAQGAIIAQAEAQVASAAAQVKSAEADVERAALEYDRSYKLAQTNFGSQQRLEQATADRDRTAAARRRRQGEPSRRHGRGSRGREGQSRRAQGAERRGGAPAHRARDRFGDGGTQSFVHARARARSTGSSATRRPRSESFVQPGTRLMALVPVNDSYVDANFKETQLADIKPGQKVDVAIDALDGRVVEGVVSSISPASGAQFSLLPPDNATGNFTKVVQRVAVRITFPEEVLKAALLRPGLSVVATVHTRDPDAPKPTLLGALGLEAFATRNAKP